MKFWSSLEKGFDAVTDMGNRRWAMDQVYDPNPLSPGKMYTRRAALLDRIDEFDPELFGISDQEATAMDPQQRLLLEISREAIEHAGYAPKALAGSATGVFVSLMNIEYATLAGEITAYLGAGNSLSVAAGRISYVLGLPADLAWPSIRHARPRCSRFISVARVLGACASATLFWQGAPTS